MNQILYVDSKKKNHTVTDIKKVILFFAIAILILGIIFIGIGSYVMLTNQDKNPSVGAKDTQPQVDVTKEEGGENIVITVTHDKAIAKITYQWNKEEIKEIQGNNRSSLSETIELPFGTNMLNLTVIDVNGKETTYQKEYVVDGNGKPVIDLVLTNDNKIKITVQDAQSLKYMVYTWNNTQETKVEANTENLQLIEREIEIPLGQNTLKVEAVNKNDVITMKELEVKGVKSPKVDLSREGEYLVIKVEDDSQIERIEYNINGKDYQMDVADKNYTVLEGKQKLEVGENKIIFKAYNKQGGQKEVKVKTIVP